MAKSNVPQHPKPKIVIFTTGGTILSEMDPDSGIVSPALTGKQLLSLVDTLGSRYDVESVEFCNMPGSDLSLRDGLALAKAIRAAQAREEIRGVVVLQGTDTMDEIPYLIHLIVPTQKPVVFTGAMKSMKDIYSDAVGNVLGATEVAANPASANRGVLVYFNETIFSAADLIKSHASRIDAFDSVSGPMGSIVSGKIHYVRTGNHSSVYDIDQLDIHVPLLKVYTGVENDLLEYCLDHGAKGLVIEGYGSGNVPATMVPALQRALDMGVPVVVTTRCTRGESYACYGYVGGGAQLSQLGVILAGPLSGIKSRILLTVLLAAGADHELIREAFSDS